MLPQNLPEKAPLSDRTSEFPAHTLYTRTPRRSYVIMPFCFRSITQIQILPCFHIAVNFGFPEILVRSRPYPPRGGAWLTLVSPTFYNTGVDTIPDIDYNVGHHGVLWENTPEQRPGFGGNDAYRVSAMDGYPVCSAYRNRPIYWNYPCF